ncbi:hypothetical protein CYMTET_13382 [Cymbomonas tetramitiformis]|uniref:PH domain-containing protein n=1 Tax=Cymbomonas tetramitiformis TaxID=36881 RepID=A0AAE0GIL6_9CHLO|nr:hypothetical protein CYMTET_13382 [Cymbomonas tetramitiformis]
MAVQIDGYLKKKNSKTSVLMRNWNKRWFSLSGDTLSYSKTPREKQPSGTFCIADIISVSKTNDNEFEVVFPEKTFTLRADDAVEVKRWLEALHTARHSYTGSKRMQHSPTSPLEHQPQPQDHPYDTPPSLQERPVAEKKAAAAPPSPRSMLSKPQSSGNAFGAFFSGEQERPGSRAKADSEETTDVMEFGNDDLDSPPSRKPPPSQRQPAPRQGFQKSSTASEKKAEPDAKKPDSVTEVAPVGNIVADADWLQDDWDDDDSGSEADSPADVSAGKGQELLESFDMQGGSDNMARNAAKDPPPARKHPGAGKKPAPARAPPTESWGGRGSLDKTDDEAEVTAPHSSTEVRPVTPSVGAVPVGRRDEKPGAAAPVASGVANDENWLEEDWDSDEE